MAITLFFIEHGTTIMVSTVVFALMALVTAVMTRGESGAPPQKIKKTVIKIYTFKKSNNVLIMVMGIRLLINKHLYS